MDGPPSSPAADDRPTDPGAFATPAPRGTGPSGPRALPARAVAMWRAQALLRLLIFHLPVSMGLGFGLSRVDPAIGGVAGATWLLIQGLLAVTWPSLEWAAFRYELRQHDLLVQSGVLFRQWSSVPLHRIQHVDTRQGPVERAFGLSRVLVYTAAGMSADGSVPALTAAEAAALRDELARRGGDDGV